MDTERNLPFLKHYALEVRLLDLPEAGAGSGTGGGGCLRQVFGRGGIVVFRPSEISFFVQ